MLLFCMQMFKILLLVCLYFFKFFICLILIFFQFGLKILYSLILWFDSAAFTDYVGTSFKYSVLLLLLFFFLPAAYFLNAALCWSICVWILNKSPKRHLPHGFLFRSIHSPPFYACKGCMSQLILVCNFACDLCCFIVNVYLVKSSQSLCCTALLCAKSK